MIKITLLALFVFSTAYANEPCSEISQDQMTAWMQKKPDVASIGYLFKAKQIIDAEQRHAVKIGNDKTAHCYLGCRISAETDFETAKYVAWQKEYNDATDCKPKSKFEEADYGATIKGAIKGSEKTVTLATKKICTTYCKKAF